MKPVIVGCRTDSFPAEQLAVFEQQQPFGMTLFAEPCMKGPDAIRHVIAQFKDACPHARIFIDAEGGKVNRLKPEYGFGWRDVPSPRSFADTASIVLDDARRQIFDNAQKLGRDLINLGINVNCAPVADLVSDESIQVKGDDGKPHATSASMYQRSFGDDPMTVAECARAFANGLESVGVVPVIKHVPGYGRISADPHYAQSGIKTLLSELENSDFVPFARLNNYSAMMTGHVIYNKIDPMRCATLSKRVIKVIRDIIGFHGVIITDTIEMNAIWPEGFSTTERDQFGMGLPLTGTLSFLTQESLRAGCDLVMHSDCSRNFAHTVEVLEAAPVLEAAQERWLLQKMSIGI